MADSQKCDAMLVIGYGTRPEWLKLKPIVDQLCNRNIEHTVLFTGQHKDLIPEGRKDLSISIGRDDIDNRMDRVSFDILRAPELDVINTANCLIVVGDTTSAFILALAAFHRRVPIAHIEAGLRTKNLDSPYPEEGYRQMISRIATYNFCPTYGSYLNLENDGISTHNIKQVGNTILDLVKSYGLKPTAVPSYASIPPGYQHEVLITLHRRENIPYVVQWFESFNTLANEYPKFRFCILTHPSVPKQYYGMLDKVAVESPLPHREMCNRIAKCRLIITDSGGLQEEGAFLRKRVVVCRTTTERPEGVGDFSVMSHLPYNLPSIVSIEIEGHVQVPANKPCPYGDGTAAQQIVEPLLTH